MGGQICLLLKNTSIITILLTCYSTIFDTSTAAYLSMCICTTCYIHTMCIRYDMWWCNVRWSGWWMIGLKVYFEYCRLLCYFGNLVVFVFYDEFGYFVRMKDLGKDDYLKIWSFKRRFSFLWIFTFNVKCGFLQIGHQVACAHAMRDPVVNSFAIDKPHSAKPPLMRRPFGPERGLWPSHQLGLSARACLAPWKTR